MAYAEGNIFGFFPDNEGKAPPPGTYPNTLAHWAIDPESDRLHLPKPETVIAQDNEFYRVDDRFVGYKTRYIFGAINDDSNAGTDWGFVAQRIGGTLDAHVVPSPQVLADLFYRRVSTLQLYIQEGFEHRKNRCLFQRTLQTVPRACFHPSKP